jgi:DsbE subfamily thiol:disulfide oxidoreductase
LKNKKTILIAILALSLFFIVFIVDHGEKKTATVGLYAPDFEVTDVSSNRKISSSQLKGKVLFINFWASWCDPCREEMPSIERLFRHFMNNQNFVMLPILYRDDPQDGLYYLKQNGFNLPLTIDTDGQAAKVYGVTGVPETYIVDKKGVLRQKIIGPYEWDSPDVITFIADLLDE